MPPLTAALSSVLPCSLFLLATSNQSRADQPAAPGGQAPRPPCAPVPRPAPPCRAGQRGVTLGNCSTRPVPPPCRACRRGERPAVHAPWRKVPHCMRTPLLPPGRTEPPLPIHWRDAATATSHPSRTLFLVTGPPEGTAAARRRSLSPFQEVPSSSSPHPEISPRRRSSPRCPR